MKIRTFIAINFSDEVKKRVADYLQPIKRFREPIRYVRDDAFHITLKFLGEVEEQKINEITGELEQIAHKYQPFEFFLEGNGAFPSLNRAKVLWIGCRVPDVMIQLQAEVEYAMALLGFEKETRSFKPHLTIGRVKGRLSSEYMHYFEKHVFENTPIRVERIDLMKSILSPQGARYSVLSSFQLAGT